MAASIRNANDLFFRAGFRRLAEVPMGGYRVRRKEPEGRVQTRPVLLTSDGGDAEGGMR